jgi:hypothetical protein
MCEAGLSFVAAILRNRQQFRRSVAQQSGTLRGMRIGRLKRPLERSVCAKPFFVVRRKLLENNTHQKGWYARKNRALPTSILNNLRRYYRRQARPRLSRAFAQLAVCDGYEVICAGVHAHLLKCDVSSSLRER